MNEWKIMYQCDKCGHISGWKLDECCGGCDTLKNPIKDKYGFSDGYDGWDKVVVKWSFKGSIFNPFSWCDWGWIVKYDK
ncbi:hypothetical protein [Bacillus licheniformis]|uniref:hypothetical protein n=1 Tax=Bacillus licheniformis TaxID=1402 RepID=UPI0007799039|nr:hypothetical protein [Bacillus licheniformis]